MEDSISVVMLTKYPDGAFRMISQEKIIVGDQIGFINGSWVKITANVSEIIEERPANGEWKERPISYRLKIA